MKTFFIIVGFIIAFILLVYFGRKLMESLINLKYAIDKKTTTSGGHIVINKKDHKCEETGEHKLLPFD